MRVSKENLKKLNYKKTLCYLNVDDKTETI